jgi:glycogen synthase
MRILVLTNMYPPQHLGGYELSCRDVVERWRRAGHDVLVLTSDLALRRHASDEVGVQRTLRFYWRDHKIVSPSVPTRCAIERNNQRVLRRTLETFRPSVVSAWHMGAMSLSLLTTVQQRRIPLVLVVCDDWMVYGPRTDAWTRIFRTRPNTARMVTSVTGLPTSLPELDDAVVCFVSEHTRAQALRHSPWRPRLSTVVHSGLDPAEFGPPAPHRRWEDRFLYVGRIDERKGVHIAIDTAWRIVGSTLTICGRGDDRYVDSLRGRVKELGIADRVTFTSVERHELRGIYASSDVLLFPILWDEPFGLVPLEAMAAGVPVVATARGGSAEFLVGDENCIACPEGDSIAFSAAVRRLAGDPELRARIERNGVRTAQRFTIDRYATELEEQHLIAASQRVTR